MKILIANIVSILCVVIAGYLAIQGKEGWGWFLFGGIICLGSISFSDSKDDVSDEVSDAE